MTALSYLNNAVPRPIRGGSRLLIRRDASAKLVLTVAMYVSLWRATGMWYGLPANFDDGAYVDPVPMKLLLYSIIPLCAFYGWLEPRRFFGAFRGMSPLLMVVGFFSATSLIVSIDVSASLKGILATLVLASPAILFRAQYGIAATFRIFSAFAVAAAFINVAYTAAFSQYAVMRGSYAGMVKGAFYHKNLLGQFCAVSFICLLPTSRIRPTYGTIVRLASMACLAALIVATRSSTAVVLTFLGSTMIYSVKPIHMVQNKLSRLLITFAIFIVVIFAAATFYLGVAEALASAFGKDLTFSGRTLIWEQLIPLIREKPIFGYGFAMFRQPEVMIEYVRATWDARSTHNTYLELALNIGVPGTAAWIIFLFIRLFKKIAFAEGCPEDLALRRKEFVIIFLTMFGAMTEAGMMLAPFIVWPQFVACLSEIRPKNRYQKRHNERLPRSPSNRLQSGNLVEHSTFLKGSAA